MRDHRRHPLCMLLIAPLVGVTIGCSAAPPVTGPAASASQVRPTPPPVDTCPMLATEPKGATRSRVAIDYVDFVNYDGRQYLTGLAPTSPISRADLREVVTHSRCSLSALNERTGRDPGTPRDGDTGFLPSGTAIYAVHGWAPECRLAAERDGKVQVYLAQDPAADQAQPAACALD